MADATPIEWTDASWNPLRARNTATGKVGWFCTHVSEGCRNCYAEGFNRRLGTGVDYKPQGLKAGRVELFLDPVMLTQPLRWRKPRMIFVGSMTDVFADFVTDDQLDQIFAVMMLCDHHIFQILTKRPDRMRAYLKGVTGRIAAVWTRLREELAVNHPGLVRAGTALWPPPHVWLGVSVEDQAGADERIPVLLDTPAAVRWISAEPLLGPVDLTAVRRFQDGMACKEFIDAVRGSYWTDQSGLPNPDPKWAKPGVPFNMDYDRFGGLNWVVAGGESGHDARPMHPDWARQLRDQCAAAGVPFLFKQWGAWSPAPDHHSLIAWAYGSGQPNVAWPDGQIAWGMTEQHGGMGRSLIHKGKKAAGRLLDGVVHDGFPEARS